MHVDEWLATTQTHLKALGILRGVPQHLGRLESVQDLVSREMLLLASTDPPSVLNPNVECIYGPNDYLELITLISSLLPIEDRPTELCAEWHDAKPRPSISLRYCYRGQSVLQFLPRITDFARLELLTFWNLFGGQLHVFGGAADWFVLWSTAEQAEDLAQRGWDRVSLTPKPDWLEAQLRGLLMYTELGDPLALEMQEKMLTFMSDFTPACWVYRGAFYERRGELQRAWEAWTPALNAGLRHPFSEILSS